MYAMLQTEACHVMPYHVQYICSRVLDIKCSCLTTLRWHQKHSHKNMHVYIHFTSYWLGLCFDLRLCCSTTGAASSRFFHGNWLFDLLSRRESLGTRLRKECLYRHPCHEFSDLTSYHVVIQEKCDNDGNCYGCVLWGAVCEITRKRCTHIFHQVLISTAGRL